MLILASSSPRRAYLLSMIGLDFRVLYPTCDETLPHDIHPEEAVRRLSTRKADWAQSHCNSEDTIIAADTLVFQDGRTMGKPEDEHEAHAMLRALSGAAHEVYTGLAVRRDGVTKADTQMTRVFFRVLSDTEIQQYIHTGEPMDKAGAYGIQDRGALFVSRIEGDFYNVMGLPLCLLSRMLRL